MLCPRRMELGSGLVFKLPTEDTWRDDKTCSYCGSLSPEEFMQRVEAGSSVTPTDKNYKAYIDGSGKFYFQHLSDEQQKKFIELLNEKKLVIGIPGHFYVLPFFIRV